MATKIVTKNSSTASAVPTASDLVQGELAVNVADKRLFTEDNAGAIVELGTNPSGNVTFQDNGKAIFGAGSDLQIYHDGSNSYIDEAGQGTLYVRADSATSIANPSNTLSARFRPSTSVSLYYNGAEKLATTSTGIDVTGNLTMASGGSIVAGGVNDLILNAGESGTPDIYLQSGSSTKVKIEGSNGNVGIGTGSPSEKLHVQGDGADILLTDSAGGQTAKLGATGSNNGLLELNNSAHVGTVFLNSSGDSYLNGGNVGIGTSSPSSYFSPQLVVHSSSNLGGITIRSNATTDTNYLLFADGTSGNERYRGYVSYDHNADTMKLATGASPAITIDSSGRLGLGVTPEAWSSVFKVLRVGTGSSIAGESGGTSTWFNTNAYYDGSWKRISTNTSAQIAHTSDGKQEFKVAAAGSAGGAISWNTAMTVDNSGNLLVGQTVGEVIGVGNTTEGISLGANGRIFASYNGQSAYLNRNGTDGALLGFYRAGTSVGSIGTVSSNLLIGTGNTGFRFFDGATKGIFPDTTSGAGSDGAIDLGKGNGRFDDIYATNGTIQTSDRNEKQDIAELSDAEQRVAVAAKGLLRKFRWKDSVAEKGDEARTHFGIIAQDLQAAFAAEGLDAGDYAMFISSTWTDEETNEEKTRMGVRYSELLAFIIAAI